MTDFVLSTSILALQSTELCFFVLWTVILTPESIESGIFVLWKRYSTHAAEIYGIRQLKAASAAQPKGCSACFVLVLVGIVMRAVQENRRTMSQLLKHSGIARAQRDRGRGKDGKYSG